MKWHKNTHWRRRKPYVHVPLVAPLRPPETPHRPGAGLVVVVIAALLSLGGHGASAAYWWLNKEEWKRRSDWRKSYNVQVTRQRPRKPRPMPVKPKVEPPRPRPRPKLVKKHRALPRKRTPRPRPKTPPRETFGMDKKSFTDNKNAAVAQRVGNTQMKSQEKDYTPPAKVTELPEADPAPPPPRKRPRPRPLPRPSTYNLPDVTTRPRVVKWVQAKYTDQALDEGVEGIVKAEVVLNRNGNPVRVRIVKSLGYGLDERVKQAVLASRFTPCKVRGEPVSCRLVIPNRFRLN